MLRRTSFISIRAVGETCGRETGFLQQAVHGFPIAGARVGELGGFSNPGAEAHREFGESSLRREVGLHCRDETSARTEHASGLAERRLERHEHQREMAEHHVEGPVREGKGVSAGLDQSRVGARVTEVRVAEVDAHSRSRQSLEHRRVAATEVEYPLSIGDTLDEQVVAAFAASRAPASQTGGGRAGHPGMEAAQVGFGRGHPSAIASGDRCVNSALHEGKVVRRPEAFLDEGIDIVGERPARHAILHRLAKHRRRDSLRGGAEIVHGRVDPAFVEVALGGVVRERERGGSNHAVGDLARLAEDRSESETGKDEGVVPLAHRHLAPVVAHIAERRSRRDDRPAVRPRKHLGGVRFAAGGWVRERKDDRSADVLGDRAHHRFVEGAAAARKAEQNAGARMRHDVEKVGRSAHAPGVDGLRRLREGALVRLHRAAFDEQPAGVEHEDARVRLR